MNAMISGRIGRPVALRRKFHPRHGIHRRNRSPALFGSRGRSPSRIVDRKLDVGGERPPAEAVLQALRAGPREPCLLHGSAIKRQTLEPEVREAVHRRPRSTNRGERVSTAPCAMSRPFLGRSGCAKRPSGITGRDPQRRRIQWGAFVPDHTQEEEESRPPPGNRTGTVVGPGSSVLRCRTGGSLPVRFRFCRELNVRPL